jgi:hypothetical protein
MFKVFGFLTKREGIEMRALIDYYENKLGSKLTSVADSSRARARKKVSWAFLRLQHIGDSAGVDGALGRSSPCSTGERLGHLPGPESWAIRCYVCAFPQLHDCR